MDSLCDLRICFVPSFFDGDQTVNTAGMGFRCIHTGNEMHDELRFFQRMDLRPDPKRQPVTYRPNESTRATPVGVINNGNQAGGGTVEAGLRAGGRGTRMRIVLPRQRAVEGTAA